LAEEETDILKFWKKLSLLDAIYGVSSAWSKIKSHTLSRSWKNILENVEEPAPEEEDAEKQEEDEFNIEEMCNNLGNNTFFENVDKENIEEWLCSDMGDPGFESVSDSHIIEQLKDKAETESSSDVSVEDNTNRVSCKTALTSVENLMDFADQNNFEYKDKLVLRSMRNKIRDLMKSSQKQTKVTDFFKNK